MHPAGRALWLSGQLHEPDDDGERDDLHLAGQRVPHPVQLLDPRRQLGNISITLNLTCSRVEANVSTEQVCSPAFTCICKPGTVYNERLARCLINIIVVVVVVVVVVVAVVVVVIIM